MANAVTRFMDKMLYGPVAPYRGSDARALIVPKPTPQPQRTSWVFDSHIVTEASAGSGRGGRGSTPKSTSLAYAENDAWGQENMRSFMGLTPRERKETLLAIFLANPWASNCIDTIALYIISGGMTIEPRVPNPDKSQRKKIEQLLLRINEDWDFNQYVYDNITDEMIFGETFTEYTMRGGVPHQLFSIDCVTMDTEHDRYGRVVRYKQQLNLMSDVNYLDKETIIRWWNPHKRAKVDPFSPLERVQDAILLDKKMVNWSTTFFQKGAKFPYWVEFAGDQDEAERYLAWFKQNYTGEKNAHLPPVAYNGAKFHEFGAGAVDIDFERGLDRQQTIVLSAFHVPPSIACIAESGNRLTDMSDGQRKILQYIACDPRRHRFFEKFNYRLIFPYFGEDYYVSTRYADFRDDKSLAEVADMRIRNGSIKINEARQEMGKEAYTEGGDVPLFAVSKEVIPIERLNEMADEQRQTAQQQLDQGDLNTEMLKAKVEQAKNPPPPMIPGQQGGNTNDVQPQLGKKGPSGKGVQSKNDQPTNNRKSTTGKSQAKKAPAKEDASSSEAIDSHDIRGDRYERRALRGASGSETLTHNTGMMLAFMLDEKTAEQLAIPGGEPVNNLHITLAYLGDMEDERASDKYYADLHPESIARFVATVAGDAPPFLSGAVGGVGRFYPAETDETPVIALVDIPGLAEFRTHLVETLQEANYFVADNHGYTPHITLAYIPQDASMPVESVPSLSLTFNTVMLCVGEKRIPFQLGGKGLQPFGSVEQEDYNPKTNVWEPPDIEEQLAKLKKQGYVSHTWRADSAACDICIQNDGVTVKIGDPFPSGHRIVFAHPSEQCMAEYHKEGEVKNNHDRG